MKLVNRLLNICRGLVNRIRRKPKLALLTFVILLMLILLIVASLFHKPHKAVGTITNNSILQTGVSIIFKTPLTTLTKVVIDNSSGKIVAKYTLTKASKATSPNIISNPKGLKYNIPLSEGVYSLTLPGSNKSLMPVTETVTIQEHKLTKVYIVFM